MAASHKRNVVKIDPFTIGFFIVILASPTLSQFIGLGGHSGLVWVFWSVF